MENKMRWSLCGGECCKYDATKIRMTKKEQQQREKKFRIEATV